MTYRDDVSSVDHQNWTFCSGVHSTVHDLWVHVASLAADEDDEEMFVAANAAADLSELQHLLTAHRAMRLLQGECGMWS